MGDRLKYLNRGQIREEIAYAVGADPSRYGVDSSRGLKKADMARIAERLQPAHSDLDIQQCDLRTLYERVCGWAGGEYQRTAGKQWGINRENLKRIHRAVGASDPREIANPETPA